MIEDRTIKIKINNKQTNEKCFLDYMYIWEWIRVNDLNLVTILKGYLYDGNRFYLKRKKEEKKIICAANVYNIHIFFDIWYMFMNQGLKMHLTTFISKMRKFNKIVFKKKFTKLYFCGYDKYISGIEYFLSCKMVVYYSKICLIGI